MVNRLSFKKFDFSYRVKLQIPIILFFICICFFYFYIYDSSIVSLADVSEFGKLINIHDHNIYQKKMMNMTSGSFSYQFNNDYGISFLYYMLFIETGLSSFLGIYWFSILFNLIFLLLIFLFYNKVCSYHKLSDLCCLMFFLNLSFIYFCQLINKDMLTVFVLIIALYYGIKEKYLFLFLLLPFSFLIRQQLALCILTYIFIMRSSFPRFWMVVSYILSSLAAAYITRNFNIISSESLGDGFSSYLFDFNKEYFVGYLIFNPLRFIQFFLSVPQSVFSIYSDGYIDFAALLRFLSLPLMIPAFLFLKYSLKNIKILLEKETKSYVVLVYSFSICWLMNPTVNARYFMLILPVMVIGYFACKKYLKND